MDYQRGKCLLGNSRDNNCEEKTKKCKPYISEKVIKMGEEEAQLGKREEYVKLKRNLKAIVRRDCNLWLEEAHAKINQCKERFKSKELFDKIKKMKKQNFKAKDIVIKEKKSGKVLTKKKRNTKQMERI